MTTVTIVLPEGKDDDRDGENGKNHCSLGFYGLEFFYKKASAVDDLYDLDARASGQEVPIGKGAEFVNTAVDADLYLPGSSVVRRNTQVDAGRLTHTVVDVEVTAFLQLQHHAKHQGKDGHKQQTDEEAQKYQ